MDFGEELTILAVYDPEDERPKKPLLAQRAIEFAVWFELEKTSHSVSGSLVTALSGAQPPYARE